MSKTKRTSRIKVLIWKLSGIRTDWRDRPLPPKEFGYLDTISTLNAEIDHLKNEIRMRDIEINSYKTFSIMPLTQPVKEVYQPPVTPKVPILEFKMEDFKPIDIPEKNITRVVRRTPTPLCKINDEPKSKYDRLYNNSIPNDQVSNNTLYDRLKNRNR